MQAQEIYDALDRIRTIVQDNATSDGSFPSDNPQIMIVLELCETVIKNSISK